MATTPLSPFAQGVVDNALQATFPQQHTNPDPLGESILGVLNERSKQVTPAQDDGTSNFSKQFFGVDSPDQILKAVGPSRNDPNTIIYEFAGDGQRYNAPADKTPEEVLEAIWDKKSPGIWGAAKGATLYNMPSELSSALAYGLEGVGMENLGQEWHQYADGLKEEFNKNYGQYTVPDVQAAWDQGKLYDYALQTIGAGVPYMGLALAGGMGGGLAAAGSAGVKAGTGAARLGAFLGAAGVTAPVTIAQFADRQVQELKAQGVENPRDQIDWGKAATLGTLAAGLQALPVDSILFAGPVLSTLEKWGVDLGSKMSSRLLGNMADVAGTNALVGMGTAGLSRMNADMPLLDDEAKAEYLNAGVMGTIVGVPFGLYKGYRYQPKPKAPVQPIDSSFLGDTRPERPVSEAAAPMKEDIIYGTDQSGPAPLSLPPPISGIIRDPNADYGITDRVQAADYLRNVKYTDKDGTERDALRDITAHFQNKLNRTPSDQDLIQAARKTAFVRSREAFLKRTPDGVMYKDIDDQPQIHSNDDKILTKAAALTDQYGYLDTVVRNLSDATIEKLYKINVQRDLEKSGAKYPDEIRQKVMADFENFVDKKVMEDVQQYGSIYKRPDAQERINKNIKATNQLLSENPRKKLAEALMNKRRSEAEAKQQEAAKGEADPVPFQQPFYGEDVTPRSPKRSSYWKDLDGNMQKRSDMDNYAPYIEDVPIEFLEKIKGNKLRMTKEEMEALKKDIQENGLNNPLIVNVGLNSRTAKLGEGNHRLQALKELGYTHAPVRISTGREWGSELNNSGLIDGLLIPEKGKYFKSEAKPSEVFRTGPVPKQKLLDLPVEPVKPIEPTATEMKWAGAKEATKKYEADMRDYRKALKEYKQQLKEVQEENARIQRRNESTGVRGIYPKAPDKVTQRGRKFIEEPPVDGEAFGPYAGMRVPDPMAIRGLLEYKPVQTAEALIKAATMPGPNATQKLTKSKVIEALLKSPLYTRLLETGHSTTAELRAIAEKYWREKIKHKVRFKTAKGSVYTIDPVNGRTKRNKAYRPEHGEKEQGQQPISDATVYVDEDNLKRMAVPTGSPWEIVVDPTNGVAHLLTWNAAEKRWGTPPSGRNIPFSTDPTVGSTPVEFWKKGKHGFSKVHFGNKIIEIMDGDEAPRNIPDDAEGLYKFLPKPGKGEFRQNPNDSKSKPRAAKRETLNDVSEQYLNQLLDETDKLASDRNADLLKKYPDLGPSLNAMFKKFAEMSANVKIGEKPRVMKATKKFSEQVMNRVKLLDTVSNVFNKIHPNLSKVFRDSFDRMLAGKELDKASFNAMLTSLHTAFNINKPDKINTEAVATWYKNMRQFLPDKTIDALNKNRQFFSEWYADQDGINPKDLGNFRTEDLEAQAFAKYLKGELNVNVKKFKDLRQKAIFSAFEKSFKQLNKEFGDIGYKKLEDILEYNDSPEVFEQNSKEVPPEARRPGAFADRVIDEVNKPKQEQAQAKVDEIKEAAVEANAGNAPPKFRGPQTKSGRDSKDPFLSSDANNIGEAAGFFSFVFSIPKMARKFPIIAKVHNVFVKQKDIAATVDTQFTKQFDYVFSNLANRDWDKMNRAHDILDHMRNTKQLMAEDTQGRIVFKDENGVDTLISKVDSDIIKGVADFYKVGIREDMAVTRELLEHMRKEYGVGKDSSLQHLKDTVDYIDKLAKDNPLPEFRNKYLRDKETMEAFYNELRHGEELLGRDVPYVPHMRFGDYVVWVKDRKTGNLVHMETLSNTDNILGLKTSKLPSSKHADQKIDQLGLRKKYDPRDYEFSHGQLTYNSAAKLIQKGMLSMELIQSLNATGLERNINLAHELATGIKDPVSFMKAWSEDAASTKSHIMKYILAQGKGRYMMKAADEPIIAGYDRNWDNVMDNYKNSWKNSIARKATAMELAQTQKDIALGGKIAPEIKKYTNDYIDYIMDPHTDYGALRNFNFFWTMGYRMSTALLQLATLPTQSAAYIVGYTGNPLSAMTYLTKAVRAYQGIKKGDKNYEFFDAHPGYFRQSMTEDAIAKEVNTDLLSEWGPSGKKVEKGFNFIKNNAGFFVSNAENLTRKTTFMAFRDMFKDSAETTRKALKAMESDYDWQYFWKTNEAKMDVEEALALYHMRLVHAEFGKSGRGPMQRGLFGSLAFPFMTYPQQMLELLFEQMAGRQGSAGVVAGLYTMGAYVALSGLNGVPAYDLWKSLYEEYEKKVNGRMVDLNMQLEAGGMPEFLRRGALSTVTGWDMSSRLSQDVIGQNLLIGLLKDDIKVGEITGVPGRTLVEMMGGAADVLSDSSSKSVMEKVQPFLPSVGKDVVKTAQVLTEPENYWKTKSGKILSEPGSRDAVDTARDVVGQSMGFTPLDKTVERERLYMQQRANQEFTGWKSRLAEQVAAAEYLMYLGSTQDDNDKYKEGRDMRADVTKELREYAKENDIKLDSSFWRGFRTSVQERLWQKKNPGKIKNPSKQERRYESILSKDKDH